MEIVYIYTLSDPRTNQIRYVGKTKNPIQRRKNHLNQQRDKNTHNRHWLNQLRNLKLKPIFEVIDEAPEDNWQFWEKYWISQCLAWGYNLTNWGEGGEGLTTGNQTSFKSGQISWMKGRTHSEETRKKLSEAGKGRKVSSQTIENQRKSMLGKNTGPRSMETIEKMKHTMFKPGIIPWNTGKRYTTVRKKVYQYSAKTGIFIREWKSRFDIDFKVNPIGILHCIHGRAKTAAGFIWSYSKMSNISPVIYTNPTNNKIKNSLK